MDQPHRPAAQCDRPFPAVRRLGWHHRCKSLGSGVILASCRLQCGSEVLVRHQLRRVVEHRSARRMILMVMAIQDVAHLRTGKPGGELAFEPVREIDVDGIRQNDST